MYFIKDSEDYYGRGSESTRLDKSESLLLEAPISDMRSEQDILHERIEKDLVAFGEFSSIELMDNSVNPDDFTALDIF